MVADPSFDPLIESATALSVPVRKVALRADGAHDGEATAKADPTAGLIYLCNPGNASGAITPRADIEWLLANTPASAVLEQPDPFSPLGRRCPAGADEGTGEAWRCSTASGLRPVPSPNPRAPARASSAGSAGTRASGAQAVPSRPVRRVVLDSY